MEKGFVQTQKLSETGGTAQDSSQDVSPPLVTGEDTVADEEGDGAAVIGNYPYGDVVLFIFPVFPARHILDMPDNLMKEIAVVVTVYSLHYGCQPLKSHSRIDIRFGQGGQSSGRVTVELREDEVPYLDVASAFAFDIAVRLPAADFFTLVEVDFGAGAAGTGIAHGPEIILFTQAEDPLGGELHLFIPYLERLVVVLVDAHPQLVRRDTHDLRQKFPSPGDGLVLEIITE